MVEDMNDISREIEIMGGLKHPNIIACAAGYTLKAL